jgi:ATPase subunit of ABC transporter with duplicated ATPase domains
MTEPARAGAVEGEGLPDGGVHSAGLHIRGATLEVSRLVKAFAQARVVDEVSFRIDGGTFLTLLGPCGSG